MFAEFNWMDATSNSPIFLVLVLCSIVTLGIALERVYYFWKRRGDTDETLQRALKKIRSGALREASWACETSAHPMGPVAAEVFKHLHAARESLEERLQIALSKQKLLLERNLNVLGTMAAIAPLIGLLGTVWGIMRAFHDMAQTGSAAPSVVAAGVAEALTTTAAGLVVAVPALMLYNHFSRRMNVMLTVAENNSRSLRTALLEETANDQANAPQAAEGSSTPPGQKRDHGAVQGPRQPEPARTR
ncbi:MAG: MotA/TolQ/ExbB proton channel family protein [Candidatus Krumholzibacteria bacterium]|nr:MotA/TolQ/ExbB proton channel family protein [Candidatus Krumholzibacteria bacterium]